MENHNHSEHNAHDHMHWKNKKFWGVIAVLVIILIVICFHQGSHGYYPGMDGTNLHSISVAGHGEVFATPDVAEFSFSASDKETTVSDAQAKMSAKANAAIEYLKKNGVDEKDIKTTDYSANPTYEYKQQACPQYGGCTPGTQVLTGYEVSETVSVKLRDTSKSGDILQGVGQVGVSNISGLSFTIDNPDVLKEQARKMAIDKAMAEAKQLAKDLRVHLGKVISFDENGNNPGPVYYDKAVLQSAAGNAAPTAPAPEIQTGQNKITSDVVIVYEIR